MQGQPYVLKISEYCWMGACAPLISKTDVLSEILYCIKMHICCANIYWISKRRDFYPLLRLLSSRLRPISYERSQLVNRILDSRDWNSCCIMISTDGFGPFDCARTRRRLGKTFSNSACFSVTFSGLSPGTRVPLAGFHWLSSIWNYYITRVCIVTGNWTAGRRVNARSRILVLEVCQWFWLLRILIFAWVQEHRKWACLVFAWVVLTAADTFYCNSIANVQTYLIYDRC